ncbi:MAG TPA: Ig-like domain-containing protein [Gemmatimonadaceae bacterium]|nr:Ig-like domain-containing protein [Gemmatimonadaceae bacterium]
MSTTMAKPTGFGSVTRFVPAIASSVVAITTVFSFLYSSGFIGRHLSNGLRASWIKLNPVADTSFALGDTIHLAATITDKNGAVILGARPTWTSENPSIAAVLADGSVVVKSPGMATILAAVDDRTARAHIFVRQHVTALRRDKDSTVSVPEGEQGALSVRALDARGHIVRGRAVAWGSDDSTIATVDSSGIVTGRNLGRALVRAMVDDLTATYAITVVATPALVEAVDTESQHANAGTPLPQPVVVRVLSKKGRPVSGVTVRFRGVDGMGSTEPATATSDNQGRARARWTLGDLAGVQRLLVTADGADSSTTIVAEADPVASNTKLVAIEEHVTGAVSAPVNDPVGIRVTDAMGRLLAGVPVTWTALDGGSGQGLTVRTDSAGEARARWVLGGRAGTQHIRAQVGTGRSVPPLMISATVLPGAPRGVTVVSGDRQEGRVGAQLPKSVVLRVVDSTGNPVADVPLALAISAGALADSSVRTDSTGTVSLRWHLGRDIGSYTLSARVAGNDHTSPAVVTAKANPGAPELLTLDASSAKANRGALERSVVAIVKDVYGNPIPEAALRFTTTTGAVSPARAVSDAKGRARVTWKLSPKSIEHQLTASVRGSDVKETLRVESPRK